MAFGKDDDFSKIQNLYPDCFTEISRSKKKGIIKIALLVAWVFLIPAAILIGVFSCSAINGPQAAENENARLEQTMQDAEALLDAHDYKKALLTAESIEYKPWIRNGDSDNLEKQWDIERESLIDKIIAEASKNGVHLERTPKTTK